MAYIKAKSSFKIDSRLEQIRDLTDEIGMLLFNQTFGLGNNFDEREKQLFKEKIEYIKMLTLDVSDEVNKHEKS